MPASPYYVRVGDDWRVPFAVKNPDGSPVNLTGATDFRATFFQSGGPSFWLTGTNGSVVLDSPPTLGTGVATIARALTAEIPADLATIQIYDKGISFALYDSGDLKRSYDPLPIVTLSITDFAQLTVLQAAASLVLYQQGPAGAGQVINGRSGAVITLTAADIGTYSKAQIDSMLALLAPPISAVAAAIVLGG